MSVTKASLTTAPTSLCPSCRFVRRVRGRRGQEYLLCQNDSIPAKYPRQPVLDCPGYERRRNSTGSG